MPSDFAADVPIQEAGSLYGSVLTCLKCLDQLGPVRDFVGARQFIERHRAAEHNGKGPALRPIKPKANQGPCSVEGCERPAKTNELCGGHYSRLRKNGDVQAGIPLRAQGNNNGPCSVDGCERRAKAKGLCDAHYERVRKTGDPRTEKPIKAAPHEGRFYDFLPSGFWSDVSLADPMSLYGVVIVCEQDGFTLGPVWTPAAAAAAIHSHQLRAHNATGRHL